MKAQFHEQLLAAKQRLLPPPVQPTVSSSKLNTLEIKRQVRKLSTAKSHASRRTIFLVIKSTVDNFLNSTATASMDKHAKLPYKIIIHACQSGISEIDYNTLTKKSLSSLSKTILASIAEVSPQKHTAKPVRTNYVQAQRAFLATVSQVQYTGLVQQDVALVPKHWMETEHFWKVGLSFDVDEFIILKDMQVLLIKTEAVAAQGLDMDAMLRASLDIMNKKGMSSTLLCDTGVIFKQVRCTMYLLGTPEQRAFLDSLGGLETWSLMF